MITHVDTGEIPTRVSPEYIRRNLIHCKSVGCVLALEVALERLKKNEAAAEMAYKYS